MSLVSRLKTKMDRRSELINRQKNSVSLAEKIKNLYQTTPLSNAQRKEINDLRLKYQKEARELGEEYMRKEIAIIEDIQKGLRA